MKGQSKLFPTQLKFINTKYRHPLFLGGYGSGKTTTMVNNAIKRAMIYTEPYWYKKYGPLTTAQYEPTYGMVEDVLIPAWEQKLEMSKIPHNFKKSAPPRLDIYFSGKRRHRILLRSMERPERIKGTNLAAGDVDEIDTLKPDHAGLVWDNLLGRVRTGPWPQVAGYTTPEGLKWCYRKWVIEPPSHQYKIYRASTLENHTLDDSFIQSMLDAYGEKAVQAFVYGQFVDLHGDTVIDSFDEIKHVIDYKGYNPHYPIQHYTGIDFGWAHPTVILGARFDGKHLHIYDELVQSHSMIDKTIQDWKKDHEQGIFDFCDPAGNQKRENAPMTNIEIMRAKGMNPRFTHGISIMEGITIINNLLEKGLLSINPKCVKLIQALKFASWEYDRFGNFKGQSELHKDPIDALRYLCWHLFGRERHIWR